MKKMRPLVTVMASLSVLLLISGIGGVFAGVQDKQQIVVHPKHDTDDLHAVFMALGIAGLMQGKGAQVTLMLDLEGVRLADAR